jgi:photosystem II stability/assembly factor-like uncharacterized protein
LRQTGILESNPVDITETPSSKHATVARRPLLDGYGIRRYRDFVQRHGLKFIGILYLNGTRIYPGVMKRYLCLLLLVACSSPSNPKPAPNKVPEVIQSKATPLQPFVWSNPRPQGNVLRGVWGNASIAIAVGDAGTLVTSGDMGASWRLEASGVTQDLFSVFGRAANFFAVGKNGTLLSSQDSISWRLVPIQTEKNLFGIWGDKEHLWIVGDAGTMLRSDDQGSTWQSVVVPTTESLYCVWGNAKNLFITGAKGTIFRSGDQGKTWVALVTNVRYALRDIWGRDDNELFLVGDQGTLLHSLDQGDTWNVMQSNTPSHLLSIRGDANMLYAVGQFGNISRSVDNGATWTIHQLGDFRDHPRHLYGAELLAPNVALVVGEEGMLLRSTDGGAMWGSATTPMRQGLRGLASFNEMIVAVGDHGAIYTTTDLGAFWTAQGTGVDIALQHVTALPDGVFLAPGLFGTLLRSENGVDWQVIPKFTEEHLFGAAAIGSRSFLVGNNGAIFASDDRGLSWTAQESKTTHRLMAIWGKQGGAIYAVGQEGTVSQSLDLGNTWTSQQLKNPYPESASTPQKKGDRSNVYQYRLWDVVGRGENEVYAVGNGGIIWRSIDKGKTWELQKLNEKIDLFSIVCGPDQALYITGSDGAVFQSNDGKTWQRAQSNTAQDLNTALYFKDRLFTAGAFGAILTGKNQ